VTPSATPAEPFGEGDGLFRELADTAPVLIWTSGTDAKCNFFNQVWLDFTGRTMEQELGEGWTEGVHPDDLNHCLGVYLDSFERREPFEIEYRLRRYDGEYRWVLDRGRPRTIGGRFEGYIGSCIDIHDRKQAEERLRESELRFRDMADSAPVMLWTSDVHGSITFVNRRWLEFTGRALEEELGSSFDVGVHPDDAETVVSSWERASADRLPWAREYRLLRADGDYRWILDQGVPHFEAGRFTGYVGTAIDIHERRTIESELRRLLTREHTIAETLQRSLLPASLPEIEGVAMAARYLPAAEGAAVGGDWYDAMPLPDGRVAIVVGDVVGHGLRAAAAMGQLRNAFRAYALSADSPAEVLGAANRLVEAAGEGEQVMATAVLLMVDRRSGEITYTNAGHPPPLILDREGARFLEGGRSVPLGASDSAVFHQGSARLSDSATLLLYTDGLVERRGEGLAERLDQLADAAVAARPDAGLEDLCDALLGSAFATERPRDDVALIAVRAEPLDANRVTVTLPAEPTAIAQLRRRLGRFLDSAGAGENERYEILLSVSEAAGNAVEHAYGPADASFEVELAVDSGEVVADVRDSGRWRPRRTEERGRGLKIMRGLMDSVEVDEGEGGTVVSLRRRLKGR